MFFCSSKWSPHENHGIRKGLHPMENILFSYLFSRNPLNSLAVVYMPLSPVSKASKLNITDQPILPQVLSKCLYCLLMTRNDRRIVIIRSKAFPISSSIPLTGFSTFFPSLFHRAS